MDFGIALRALMSLWAPPSSPGAATPKSKFPSPGAVRLPPDAPLGAGPERRRVLDGLEGRAGRIEVGLDRTGLRVGHGQRDLDVGQASGEDPLPGVQGTAIEDLDDHLDVARVEEPEGARVGGQGDGGPLAARA